MTDKSKSWLNAKHPEAIACKKAGKELYASLDKDGIDLTGVGVSVSDDNQEAVICIYLLKEEDKIKVPTKFKGYKVRVRVTGVIKPL